jgi:hypothetical protein
MTTNLVSVSREFGRFPLPRWYAVLSQQERRFWWLCLFSFTIVFSPAKEVALFAVYFFLAGLIFWVGARPLSNLTRYILLLAGYHLLGLIYFVLLQEFSWLNHYFFLITFSAPLLLLADLRPIATYNTLTAIARLVLFFLFIEAAYGIMQGMVVLMRIGSLDVAAGDFVRGTIEPGFQPTGAGGNQMYAILMTTTLLFAFGLQTKIQLRPFIIFGMTLLAWLMASVFHTFLFFGAALAGSFVIIFRWRFKRVKRRPIGRFLQNTAVVFGAVIAILFIIFVLPRNLSTLPHFIRVSLDLQNGSYKAQATYNTFVNLPERSLLHPLIGTGPGQYSSRAALILTDEYLGGASSPFPPYVSSATDENIMSLWRNFYLRYPNGGSTYFPFYSWMSLYGEMGLLGLMVLLFIFFRLLWIWRQTRLPEFPFLPHMMIILVLYLAFLGVQDNYWEFVQAVSPAFLYLALSRAFMLRAKSSV